MNTDRTTPFGYSAAAAAGFGARGDLCWWLSQEPTGESRVRAARLASGAFRRLGSIPVTHRPDAVCISLDGSTLLVLARDRLDALSLSEPNAPVETREIRDADGTSMASPDGRSIYLSRSIHWPPIWRIDRSTGEVDSLVPSVGEVTKHHPRLALDPDGTQLAFGHVFDAIEVFDLIGGGSHRWPRAAESIPALEVRTSAMLAFVGFSTDGTRLAAISDPRRPSPEAPPQLRIGDPAGTDVDCRPFPERLPWVAVSDRGRSVACARDGMPGLVEIVDPTSGATSRCVEVSGRVLALALNGAGDRLTVAHTKGIHSFDFPVSA